MATPTLVATAGAANANTYCLLAEANTYMDGRLYVDAWTDAGNDDKNKALLWATNLLDDLTTWVGMKASDSQALRWPRSMVWDQDGDSVTSTAIPQFLKDATAEFAFSLLSEDRTLETNRDLMGFEFMKIGPLAMKIDKHTKKPILPRAVQIIIRNYCVQFKNSKTLVRM
jgi:hypothetical protein